MTSLKRNFALLGLVAVVLMLVWALSLRRASVREQTPPIAAVAPQAPAQRRLEGLRVRLNEVSQTPPANPAQTAQTHISDLTRRISTLEKQLNDLNNQARGTQANAVLYKTETQTAAANAQSQLQAQIQDLDSQIALLQNTKASEEEINGVIQSRNELRAQLQQVATGSNNQNLAATSSAQSEINDINQEKLNLENELSDVRADLTYWQSMARATPNAQAQSARIRELEEQIKALEAQTSGR